MCPPASQICTAQATQTHRHTDMDMLTLLCCFLSVSLAASDSETQGNAATSSHPTKKLVGDLLRDYDRLAIPSHPKNALEVKFSTTLQTILDLNAAEHTLLALVWLNSEWKDFSLRWNETEYEGVRSTRIPVSQIWRPDISLYNGAGAVEQAVHVEDTVVVYSDGTVSHVSPMIIKSTCVLDFTYFPYDVQVCKWKYGSWTYDGSKVNVTSLYKEVDVSSYTENSEWDLQSAPAKRHVKKYECCPEPYIDVTFSLHLKRRGSAYTYAYVAPAVLVSLLTGVLFLIPSNQHQKFTLGGLLLVVMVLLLGRMESLTDFGAGRVPILIQFYVANFIMLCLSLVLACLTSNMMAWAYRSSPPTILRKVVLGFLGRVLCVRSDNYYTLDERSIIGNMEEKGEEVGHRRSLSPELLDWRLIGVVLDRLFFVCVFFLNILFCAFMLHRGK